MSSKSIIRRQALQRRLALQPGERQILNDKIYKQFFETAREWQGGKLHSFLPIVANNEVDTWPIIREWWRGGGEVLVPVVERRVSEFLSCVISPQTRFSRDCYNIEQPIERPPTNAADVDLVLLPLLAFDEKGYRVGYGKGFYDRFLASLHPGVQRIGLSFFPPLPEVFPDPWDEKMTICITPDEVFRFS
jgi:5-formyltetrahydrofolate cyclo-ligase